MGKLKFIGTISEQYAAKVEGAYPWQPKEFLNIPYPVISNPNGYLVTVGSGCISLPTSSYGTTYNGAIDVLRVDLSDKLLDVDHYITSRIDERTFAVFLTPQTNYHHLKESDKLISNLSLDWQKVVNDILSNV